MASISKIGHSWRALVRRKGFKPLCKTFRTKSAALEWSRRVEADIDAGVHPQHGRAEAVEHAILHYRTPREHARPALSDDASTDCVADFSAWRRLRREGDFDFDPESWRILGITPCEIPDLGLARAFRAQATAVAVDLGRDSSKWPGVVSGISAMGSDRCGVRIPDHVAIGPDGIPGNAAFVILGAGHAIKDWRDRFLVLAQVTSVDEAESALATGAAGLISKGQESGGRVGEESSFILLQRVLELAAEKRIPVWCQGGIGLHTAAGAFAAGAFGVVLDAQLALLRECGLPEEIRNDIRAMDGSETRLLGGYSVHARPGSAAAGHDADLSPEDVRGMLARGALLSLGQDAALAKLLAARCADTSTLLHAMRMSIAGHLRQAIALKSFDENSPLARAHGTRYPIAQGPMTRVSDTAEFACAVAGEGALPFLALSLMDEAQSRRLLEATRDAIGAHPWGVGVLGFAAPEILEPQLALIREFRPSAVLLAGGRPAQAHALVAEGIPAYLHVPSPGLLGMFLKDGVRHFVFEGRECGGHVGPRYSFVLWEQQIALLLEFEHPEEIHLLFAGGIHDERSAATVAAIAAPLAARGAKIGVLMGTAYITTHEAVACGAVNENFRRKVIAGDTTVLLETAPGHATRCLPTNFVERFNAEKKRLQAIEADPKKIWKALEDFNIGRLRIATKGVQRDCGNLVKVGVRGQQAEGLYMIGQLAALRHSVNSIAELHRAVSRGATARLEACAVPAPKQAANAEPVAIVGMACIYPGSPDIESFWANIVEGRNLITEVPATRWNADLYYREGATERGKTPSKWGGFIDEVAFDPLRYGIPPQSLAAIEPIQLLSLEVASRALTDAGYGDGGRQRPFDRDRTSVIFGAEAGMDLSNAYVFRNNYANYLGAMPEELDAVLPDLTEDSFPGVLANVISGRIANRLGFGGVNYSVDSACASSLTALELSVKELRSGGSDMVLAGGADFHNSIHDFLMFASVKALSPSGRCRSFDDAADGICLGEGVGVMVLKRLGDAERDGDRIYAVIDGVAGSSDGKGLGLTAPRKEGQKRALERAYRQAGIMPGDIGLVEAHGTGTVVGDRTELQTLTDIYSAGGALPLRTALGSVKSQIGHTKCAAGMAGLIKVSKALYHKVLPPTLNIEKPNAGYDAHHSPFMLNGFSMPWLFGKEGHAAVSAFGFGGANFHAILSSHPASGAQVDSGVKRWSAELFLFRGETFSDAAGLIRKLGRFLRESDAPLQLRDLACTVCNLGSGPVQCAFVAGLDDLVDRLEYAQDRGHHPDICYREEARQGQGRLAFVFPGQGSQSPGMLRDLFVAFPSLHAILDEGAEWRDRMLPPAAHSREQQQRQSQELTDTRVAQPALGMADYAMATLLRAMNIAPDMLAGHSYGELVALTVAGCFDLRDLLRLSEQRGVSILEAAGDDAGCMAAVSAGAEDLARIFGADSGVVLANQNSPAQSIISGSTAAIGQALDTLKAKGIAARTIEVACAFHSPLIAGAEKIFGAALDGQPVRRPELPVYCNSTAQIYSENPADIKRQMAAQIVNPVRFVEQIERMHADGARIFVEVGPGSVLTGLIGKILAGKPHLAVATDRKGQPGIPNLLRAVAQIAVIRAGIDPATLWRGRSPARLDFDHPCKLPPSCWMVDGARARPLHGALPRHAGRVVTKPLQAVTLRGELIGAGAGHAQLSSGDRTVLQYLNNMHDLVQAQRDIMLSMLGQMSAEGHARTSAESATAAAGHRISVSIPAPDSMLNMNATPNFAHAPVAAAGDVRASLLAIVSERTGYPAEMLDAGLDLEADLSIDSIKRLEIVGELAERFGLRQRLGAEADALLERLAAQKTLEAIVACLQEALPDVAGVPAASLASSASASFVSADSAQQTLLAIVSGRTGYPEDALDLDLDLEADLSIDSIKRLEIVGELAERLGLERLLADKDSALESLAALKTLRAIVDWLKAHAGADAAASAATASASQSSAGSPEDGQIALSRYVLRSADAPGVISGHNQLAGKNFLVTDDGLGIATRFAARLGTYGACVRVIDFSENVPLPGDLAQVDGLVHLFGLNPLSRVRDAKRFFDLLRETLPHKTASLLVASGLGGGFGHFRANGQKVSGDFGHGAGLSGMLKTVAKEWPEVRVHCVDLDTSESADDLASYLEIELLADNPLAEVGYRAGSRQVIQILESPLRRDDVIDNLALDRNSVLLLTGGARGITAQIALAFARRYGCRLELVGRSPLPTETDTEPGISARDQKGLRQALIAAHPELKPADIEKRCAQIMAAREVRQSLADIEAAGGMVGYTALDVRDITAFAAHIQELYRRHGRIDGVIHGAGVVDDKLLRHKSAESFARVFDTKVRGALMLYNRIHDDAGFVVFFSSVAGAFGNKGQIDYAAANDVLDKIAHAMQARVKGRVLSINWGPWAGKGMVSAELKREFSRKGIGLIPLQVGADALLDELRFGTKDDTQIVLMCAEPESFGIRGELSRLL